MWLSIERIEYATMEDGYSILFTSQDIEQVIEYTSLMKKNAKEKGQDNRTYAAVKFEPDELKAFLNDMERNKGLDHVKN